MIFGRGARRLLFAGLTLGCFAIAAVTSDAQARPGKAPVEEPPRQAPVPPTPRRAPVEKLGDNLFRIGAIRVDTAKREMSVPGTVNGNLTALEFVANTKGGGKAYESILTLDTDGIFFNTGCLLIGLDRARSVRPLMHFDPRGPEGDPVEVLVSWQENGRTRQVNAEQLLYDREKKRVLTNSRWVYTGSMMLDNGMLLADTDGGALIGFVHTPAPIIENVSSDAVNRYGAIVLNEELGLKAGMPITVTVRALQQAKR